MDSIDLAVFQNTNVVVVGDVILDRYVWGDVSRISPEAPVPVVRVTTRSQALGGAANVAANLAGLGCRVELLGIRGQDEAGQCLSRLLLEHGIVDQLLTTNKMATITKTRIMAQGQQLMRFDEEESCGFDARDYESLRLKLDSICDSTNAIILSDYGKGLLIPSVCAEIIGYAREFGIPVLVDPKGADWSKYRGATCITPNMTELETVTRIRLTCDAEIFEAGRTLLKTLHLERLLITRGPAGMVLLSSHDEPFVVRARAREVFDVSGAGDTVIAALAAGVGTRMDWPYSTRLANTAAGIVVGRIGTQPVHADELAMALSLGQNGHHGKICDLDAAKFIVQNWRTRGETVVFANGCFDLLHAGHIRLLHAAAEEGAHLVIGLNSDASTSRLKGTDRPILTQQDRAAMLSALSCVDLVVIFEEDTPLALIEAFRPDVLVKGADYTKTSVVGHEMVEAWGGRIVLVEIQNEISTTDILNRLKRN